jgi:hypothetical protein
LPSRWKQVAVVLKVCESKARTSPPWCSRIVAAWGRCQYCSQFVPNSRPNAGPDRLEDG